MHLTFGRKARIIVPIMTNSKMYHFFECPFLNELSGLELIVSDLYFQKDFQNIRKTLTTFAVKLLDECGEQEEVEWILKRKRTYTKTQPIFDYNYTSHFTLNGSFNFFLCPPAEKELLEKESVNTAAWSTKYPILNLAMQYEMKEVVHLFHHQWQIRDFSWWDDNYFFISQVS